MEDWDGYSLLLLETLQCFSTASQKRMQRCVSKKSTFNNAAIRLDSGDVILFNGGKLWHGRLFKQPNLN